MILRFLNNIGLDSVFAIWCIEYFLWVCLLAPIGILLLALMFDVLCGGNGALRFIKDNRVERNGRARIGSQEVLSAKLYRLVIMFGIVFFYLTSPFIILIILLGTGAFVRFEFLTYPYGRLGDFEAWCFFIVPSLTAIVLSSAAVYGILRILFPSLSSEKMGIRSDINEDPKLMDELNEIAKMSQAKPVSYVYISPGSETYMREEQDGLGTVCRVLVIGYLSMCCFNLSEFRAIVGREYAYFDQEDAFFGKWLSMRIRRFQSNQSYGLLEFLSKVYSRIVFLGYIRIRVFQADRQAVAVYGSDSLIGALQKMAIDADILYQTLLMKSRNLYYLTRESELNLYADWKHKPIDERDLKKKIDEVQDEKKFFSSRPSIQSRVDAIRSFPACEQPNSRPALCLIENVELLEQKLSHFLVN